MMTNAQLRQVLEFYLGRVNDASTAITDDMVHRELLSTEEAGYGPANSMRLYEAFVRYALTASGNPLRVWPHEWLDLTVGELADALVPAFFSELASDASRERWVVHHGASYVIHDG